MTSLTKPILICICVCSAVFHRYYISKGAVIDQLGGDLNSTPLHWAIRYVSDTYSNTFAMTLHSGTCPSTCSELHLCDLEEFTSAFIHPLKSPKHSWLTPAQTCLWKMLVLAAFACKWHLNCVLYLLMLFLVTPEQTGSFVYGHSADAIWSRFIISRFWRVSGSPSGCALPAYAHRCVPYGQRTGVKQAQSDILNNDGGFEYRVMQLNAILVPVLL